MKVDMMVQYEGQDEMWEDNLSHLFPDPSSVQKRMEFEIRVDGQIAFRLHRAERAEVSMKEWLALNDFLNAFKIVEKFHTTAQLYGSAVVVRDPDGTYRTLDPESYVLTELK